MAVAVFRWRQLRGDDMTDEKCGVTELTYRQRIFVDNFIRYENATQAAIAAGYSEKTQKL